MLAASTYPFRTSPSRQNPSPTTKSLQKKEPSSGLEPETPSLPSLLRAGTGGQPRSLHGDESPARGYCTRPRRRSAVIGRVRARVSGLCPAQAAIFGRVGCVGCSEYARLDARRYQWRGPSRRLGPRSLRCRRVLRVCGGGCETSGLASALGSRPTTEDGRNPAGLLPDARASRVRLIDRPAVVVLGAAACQRGRHAADTLPAMRHPQRRELLPPPPTQAQARHAPRLRTDTRELPPTHAR